MKLVSQVVAFAFAGGIAVAQTLVWERVVTAHSPSAREQVAMSYDVSRQRVVLTGGANALVDTWEFDGADWTLAGPVGPALGYAWYEHAGSRTLGYDGVNRQTWAWNGASWSLLGQPAGAGQTIDGAIAFDALRQRAVLFGGSSWNVPTSILYEHDGVGWSLRQNGGPTPRRHHAMAFDIARGAVVLFGGQRYDGTVLQDTWEWNGSYWFEHFGIAAPPPRALHALAFDPIHNLTLLYGGSDPQGADRRDTWQWDGTSWTQTASPTAPTAAQGTAMLFEQRTSSILLFGGRAVGTLRDETWRLRTVAAVAATAASYGAGCPGPAGVPSLQPQGASVPRLGSAFILELDGLPPSPLNVPFGVLGVSDTQWNGQPLPLPLDPFGFPGCTALLAPGPATLLAQSGGAASWSILVPPSTGLIGFTFFAQGAVTAPGFNQGGIVFSNGVRCVVGI